MYLHALATAVPPQILTQPECWQLLAQSNACQRLAPRSLQVLETILTGDSGIERRHFAANDLNTVFDGTADQLNATFREAAPALAGRALAASNKLACAPPSWMRSSFAPAPVTSAPG